MRKIIHAREYIESSQILPDEIKQYLLVTSVAVNRLSTPFNVSRLLALLKKYGLRVKQIVVAYEVPPGFTRSGQYYIQDGYSLESTEESADVDIFSPGLYGLSRDFDGSFKIILFMRSDILRILRQRDKAYVKGAYKLYKIIQSGLPEEQRIGDPLAFVGVLPGKILDWGEAGLGEEYAELIKMAQATNRNSARFVVEATRRVLKEYYFGENNLVVLGSYGVLGKEIMKHYHGSVQGIDIRDRQSPDPKKLLERSSVILDCTNGESLSAYFNAGYFQPGKRYVWIVESYPVPPFVTVDLIRNSGIDLRILHIRGVSAGNQQDGGNIIPFPVYGHTMPCCTGSFDQVGSDVIVEDLYPETEFCNS